jgi:hypothetical protein
MVRRQLQRAFRPGRRCRSTAQPCADPYARNGTVTPLQRCTADRCCSGRMTHRRAATAPGSRSGCPARPARAPHRRPGPSGLDQLREGRLRLQGFRPQRRRHLEAHPAFHRIAGTADGRSEGHPQIVGITACGDHPLDRRRQDPAGHPTPAGVTGRHPAAGGIGEQYRRAVRPAHPEILTTAIADQTIGFGPGLAGGRGSRQHQGAVDLPGPMDRDSGTHEARQFGRLTPPPEAGEEAMLEVLQQIGLQVIAPIGTHPGPAGQSVEGGIRPLERRLQALSHPADPAAARSPRAVRSPVR